MLLNGTSINASQVIRDSLQATLTNVEPGYHTLRLAVSRGATNTRTIYQFIDDIQLSRVGLASLQAVPEPASGAMLVVTLGVAAETSSPAEAAVRRIDGFLIKWPFQIGPTNMQVDPPMLRLMAVGLAVAISGCSQSSENALSRNGNVQTFPVPPDSSPGHTPTPPVNKQDEAPDVPRQAGIGAALRIENGKVLVIKVLPDSPAARSELIKTNDEVIGIAEGNEPPVDVRGTKDVAKIVGMIRGPIKTVVRLTIVPAGKAEKDQLVVNLIRGDIKEINMFVDGRLLPIGAKAPNFKFVRLEGNEDRDLSQFAGRIVVVDFWATWCGPCITSIDELALLQEQHPEWAGQVKLLAVSVDDKKEDAITFVNRRQWSKISTAWAGSDVLKLYRVSGLPTIFVIDRDGTVASVGHRIDVPVLVKRLLLPSGEKTLIRLDNDG